MESCLAASPSFSFSYLSENLVIRGNVKGYVSLIDTNKER